jgi:hypothetical protein
MLVIASVSLAEKAPFEYPNNAPLTTERQGGDTVDTATVIDVLPFGATGTTIGFTDDYDAICPYTGSTSPDVVYSLVACADGFLDITLCIEPTDYDTKLYVFDANMNEIACEDDACSIPVSYVSELTTALGTAVPVVMGELYYIIVDGYGGGSGNYGIAITGLDCGTAADVSSFSIVKSLY